MLLVLGFFHFLVLVIFKNKIFYSFFIDKGKIVLDDDKDNIIDNYGILKCDIDEFQGIDSKDIVSYKKNIYGYEILVNDVNLCKKKYKDVVIDKITLDDLMVNMIKGEK